MSGAEERPWFRPKRYGYGAEPVNWKGWLATGVYLAVVAGIVWRLVGGQTFSTVSGGQAVLWWTVLIAATVAFVALCWAKTDGKWRWRWGHDEERH